MSLNRGVDSVLRSDGMRGQEVDQLVGGEPCVSHAVKDLVDRVLRLGDESSGSGGRVVRAPCEELQTGTAHAVAHADGTGELDARFGRVVSMYDGLYSSSDIQVTKGDVVLDGQGTELLDDLVDTVVGWVLKLFVRVRNDRAICTMSF